MNKIGWTKLRMNKKLLEKIRYPLLILAAGILLMLFPSSRDTETIPQENTETMAQLLSMASGAGETRLLVSEHGAVVVCQGADRASVRLDIIQAVSSYTGFSSDKIIILKMADRS